MMGKRRRGAGPRLSVLGFIFVWRACGQIRVMSPEYLVNQFSVTQGRIQGSTATFGAPFYGERVLGKLVYGESAGDQHCRDQDYAIPKRDPSTMLNHENAEVTPLNIVIVRRGKCTFVTKVRVAQAKGAHAVIIVDKEDSDLTSNDIRRIIVADDGYGTNVDIPSVLISKQEGQYLIEAAQKGQQPVVELAWDVPTDHVVVVDLWMSSGSMESYKFIHEFFEKREKLNELIKFVPHYHVFGMQSSNDYNDLCASTDGEYCAEDPDGSGPVTGSMVLDEDIRQLCIHELYKVKRDPVNPHLTVHKVEYSKEYWQYVHSYLDECPLDGQDLDHRFGLACSKLVMSKVGIDQEKVEHCARTTRVQKLMQQRQDTAWSPRALRINGWRYSGAMDADLVTRAICAAFVEMPPACAALTEMPHPILQKVYKRIQGGVSIGSFVTTLVVIVVAAFLALYLYKRSLTSNIHRTLREEVMLEVQAQMDSYKQLSS